MSFAAGSLVRARGREWVVLPESADDLLVLRPLGGTDDEIAGIHTALEAVTPAQFELPDPTRPGDYRSARLLRDAVRLGFRNSAGPFRSFGRLAVDPRPYQLVPLLMALKLDPVRLLIADDVGIGKTIEAGLIARELLDRGEVGRLAVLCPPHLAEQWQAELRDKFHIDAELVLAGTAARLERGCALGQSLFDIYPHVIVSTDFIKSDRRRDEFLRTCPELVIVDEAHTCAAPLEQRGARHQRYQLVRGLADNTARHVVLLTATPHSGNEEAFHALLGLLDPELGRLPDDLSGPGRQEARRRLAAHFVQRRRGDIVRYLDAQTDFPEREASDESYRLTASYQRFLQRVLGYVRERVADPAGGERRQRVRWWSALALLRAIASSPAAAAATLRNRAAAAAAETAEEADAIGRQTVLDLLDEEAAESTDLLPGADDGEEENEAARERRRLQDLAREAEKLQGVKEDAKLAHAVTLVKKLVAEGWRPILFCRFIPTAEYVAAALREALGKDVEVAAVTGTLPPDEREERVLALAGHPKRVLVATDCLSEGINMQEHFDAVLHYDLSWNPTRHEQREGRVDRYGQPRPSVRTITYYGVDNLIDGLVLQVLYRKHQSIRSALGVSVPVPVNTNQVLEAIVDGLVLRGRREAAQLTLPEFETLVAPQTAAFHRAWDAAAERERQSRTIFAQATIGVDEVRRELAAAREAVGVGVDVAGFVRQAVQAHGGVVGSGDPVTLDLAEVPRALQEAVGEARSFRARFELPVPDGVRYLSRTHPLVEGLAAYLMDTALDAKGESVARRCGVIRTGAVARRTTALLLRCRYHLVTERTGQEPRELLAEDCLTVAFEGAPASAHWLDDAAAEALLAAQPEGNVLPEQAVEFLRRVVDDFDRLRPQLEAAARARGEALLDAHRRVRSQARQTGVRQRVVPQLPPDVLGLYIYLPRAGGAA